MNGRHTQPHTLFKTLIKSSEDAVTCSYLYLDQVSMGLDQDSPVRLLSV